jgi:parallel beta-helix repeat protein
LNKVVSKKLVSWAIMMCFLIVYSIAPIVPGEKVYAAVGSITTYEAESGVGNNSDVETLGGQTGGVTYSGSGFRTMKGIAESASITWSDVNVPISGSYIITFKYSNTSMSNKPVSLTVNGLKVTSFMAEQTAGESYPVWDYKSAVVFLKSGNNSVKLASEGSEGPSIDCFQLKSYSTIVEAELNMTKAGDPSTHVKNSFGNNTGTAPGFTGTGYVGMAAGQAQPAYLLWDQVVVPESGKYTIKFRYCLSGSARPGVLTVNGVRVQGTAGLGTGGWNIWKYDEVKNIDLNAGVNTIKLEPTLAANGTTNALPNFDRIEIVSENPLVLEEHTFRNTSFETTDVDAVIAGTSTGNAITSPLIDGKAVKATSETTFKVVEEGGSRWAEATIPATKYGVIGFPFNSSWLTPVSMNSYTFESSFKLKDDNANYLLKAISASGSVESLMVAFSKEGELYARSNTSANALAMRGEWSIDTIYKVKLVFHVDTKSYDMYLNGQKIVNSEPLETDTYSGGLRGLYMEVKGGARPETKILVDDVVLSGSNTVGTPPVVNPNAGKPWVEPAYIGAPVTYYVSSGTAGSDTANDGLSAQKPFKTIQKAAGMTNPGDTVLIMPGTYSATANSDKFLNITRSGAHEKKTGRTHYITYKAYDSNNKPKLLLPNNIAGVWNMVAVNANYIIVDGLEVQGNNLNINLADAEANYEEKIAGGTNWAKYALTNTNGIDTKGHHIVIRNCHVHHMAGGGIGGSGDYMTYENNISHSNSWYTMYATSGMGTIDNIDFDNNTTDYKIIFRNNIIYDNETKVKWDRTKGYSDGNGIIFDNDFAYKGRKLAVNNIVYENGGGGIHIYNSSNVDVINNTSYMNSRSPHLKYPNIDSQSGDNNVLMNNISVARDGEPNVVAGGFNNLVENNIFFGGIINDSYLGVNDRIADPKFVSLVPGSYDFSSIPVPGIYDFHLQADSPAIDYGTRTRAPQTDITGAPRLQGARYDIGAYETSYTSDNPIVNDIVEIKPPKPDVIENAEAAKGTPTIDGEIDGIWATTMAFETTKGFNTKVAPTKATVRTLWDENNLYVLAEVKDSNLSNIGSQIYERDSVELFMDENDAKSTTFQSDDGGYQVGYDGRKGGSHRGKNIAANLDSFTTSTKVVDGGYIVEAKLPLTTSPGAIGRIIGFEVQVNDDYNNDGIRNNFTSWSNQRSDSSTSTFRWGNIMMVDAPARSTDATLSDLKIGGVTVDGFTAETTNYSVVLPVGTTTLPLITATTTEALANVVVTPPASTTGTATVVVTAIDGITKKTYTINFSVIAALTIENKTSVSHFTLGTDAKVRIKVTNNTVQGQKAALLVAVYNTANNSMTTWGGEQKTIAASGEVELEVMLKMPARGNYIVKYFVWDSIDTMRPIEGVVPGGIPVQ